MKPVQNERGTRTVLLTSTDFQCVRHGTNLHDSLVLATAWACRCDFMSAMLFRMNILSLFLPTRSHAVWGLVILGVTASGAGHLKMHVISMVLAAHCLSRDGLHCGNGSLQNINNRDIRNKWKRKLCAPSGGL
jgi:hypothetical protein